MSNPVPLRKVVDKSQMIQRGRDELFRSLLGREPTKEEIQRYERLGAIGGVKPDDTIWYFIMVNEFYDDRMGQRLAEVERVADGAADKALMKIAEAVVKKSEELAAQKDKSVILRSWIFLMGMLVLLTGTVFNAGYVLGSGHFPPWVHSVSGIQRMLSWILNVPSGWIFLLASAPILLETYTKSTKQVLTNNRFGEASRSENILLYLKAFGSLTVLGFTAAVLLYLMGLNVMFS